MKTCTRCGETKDESFFGPRRRQCTPCRVEQNAIWRANNAERDRENKRRWAERNPEFVKQLAIEAAHKYRQGADKCAANRVQRAYRAKRRREAIEHYGGKCACCGETTYEFLAIDHINSDGYIHRKQGIQGSGIYLWLRKHNYPDGFQVLCHNCNLAKGFYGSCPHTRGGELWSSTNGVCSKNQMTTAR